MCIVSEWKKLSVYKCSSLPWFIKSYFSINTCWKKDSYVYILLRDRRVDSRGVSKLCYQKQRCHKCQLLHILFIKTGHEIFLQCFYVWILFYYNNYEQNLIHPLWIGYNVPLSPFWWKFNTNLTMFGCFMGIKRNKCNLTSRNLNTLPSAPLISFKSPYVTEGLNSKDTPLILTLYLVMYSHNS